MKRISYKVISIVLAFSFLTFSSNVYAAPKLVGGITINNGDEKTIKQDVDLTITAGEPTSTSKLETSQTDFSQGTLTKVVTSGDNIKLDRFLDGGFESGNFDTWDRSEGWQIVSNPVASGKYAAKSYGAQKFLIKTFDTPQKNGYIRFNAMFTENNKFHYFFEPYASHSWCAISASSDGHFYCIGANSSWSKFPIDTTYVADKWYTFEVYWFGDSSTYKVKIDGVDITNGGIVAKDSYGYLVKGLRNITFSSGGDSSTASNPAGLILDNIFITTNINPEMEEGFESGDFSKWNAVGADWQIVSSPVCSGKKSAESSGNASVMVKYFSQPLSNFYIRTRVLFTKTNLNPYPLFLGLKDGGYCHMAIASSNGHIMYYDNGYKDFSPTLIYQPNKWYQFEWTVQNGKYNLLVTGEGVNGEVKGITIKDNFRNTGTEYINISHNGNGMVLDDILVLDLTKFPNLTTNKPTYSFSGTRTSPAIDLTDVNTAISSKIDWNADTPKDTLVNVDVSLDEGVTWQTATKGGEIPGIISGTDLKGKNLLVRQRLSTTNMEVTPQLQDITVTINGVKPATGSVKMMLSNDSEFKGASWQTYVTSKKWTLTDGDGTKNVYVKFKNVLGESETFSDEILMQLEVSLNEIYNAIKKINPKSVVRVIKDKEFTELSYCQVEGKDKDNIVTATLVSVPDSEYKFSVLTGKFTSAGAKALIIGNELFLFYVIEPPSIEDIATITFN